MKTKEEILERIHFLQAARIEASNVSKYAPYTESDPVIQGMTFKIRELCWALGEKE